MKRLVLIVLTLAGIAGSAALRANDSTAEMAAGGLVLKQSRDIDMVSEDLYVSAAQIRVRYVFRNRSRRPVTTIVAFPLPDRNLAELGESDSAWPSDFRTTVDGRPVRMQVERRIFLGNVEHTALLRELNIPIGGDNIVIPATEAIERLPAVQQQRLERLGLIEGFAGEGRRIYEPRWTVRETWHWVQTFPVGRDLRVEHRYVPGAGGSAGTALLTPEYLANEDGREWVRRYCIDDAFLAGARRLQQRYPPERATITEQWVSYVLTTGANWRSPIGDFRLVVDKGSPENLVSFCGQGVRRIGPTQFEIRRRNWRPTQDLRVLILRPYRFDGSDD